jgi:hypothetical protein
MGIWKLRRVKRKDRGGRCLLCEREENRPYLFLNAQNTKVERGANEQQVVK